MLVLSSGEVRQLLDLDRLIDALAAAMTDLSAGRAAAPDRVAAAALVLAAARAAGAGREIAL